MNAKNNWKGTPLDIATNPENPIDTAETADLIRKHGGKTSEELKNLEEVKESIHAASRIGHIQAVKQHLAAGADVNVKADKFGITPLHLAVDGSHRETVELLIVNGADVNGRNYGGWTPLHTAADRSKGTAANISHKEIIELLIAKGANVNAKITSGPIRGYTPLYLAAINNNTEIADLLRKHGGKTGEELKAEQK